MRGIHLIRAIFNETLEKCTSKDCLQWEKRDSRQTPLSEEMGRNMSIDMAKENATPLSDNTFEEMRGIHLIRAIFSETLEKCTSEDCLQWEKRDTRQTLLFQTSSKSHKGYM